MKANVIFPANRFHLGECGLAYGRRLYEDIITRAWKSLLVRQSETRSRVSTLLMIKRRTSSGSVRKGLTSMMSFVVGLQKCRDQAEIFESNVLRGKSARSRWVRHD